MARPTYPELGAKLRSLRHDARLKGAELAALVDVSHSYPSRMELGLDRPNRELLKRLARVLREHGAQADYDELAELAGYADAPPAELVPVDDPAKVSVARRLLRLPLAALLALEDLSIRLHLETYEEPEQVPHPNVPPGEQPRCPQRT